MIKQGFLRIIAAVLLMLMLISCAASEPEVVPKFEASGEIQTLGGIEIVYASCEKEETILGYLFNTDMSDAAKKRIDDVEKTLDCNLTINYGLSDLSAFNGAVASGMFFSDIITYETFYLLDQMRAGYLTELSTVLDVKNTEKWGTIGQLTSMYWTGGQYGVVPAYWPLTIYNSINYPLVINENLVLEHGFTDPREYIENKTWTWDQFETTLHEMTLDLGERTLYAIGVSPPYLGEMFYRTNGNDFIEIDSDGKISIGWYSPTAIKAIERIQKIRLETCKDCFLPKIENSEMLEAFLGEDIVMSTVVGGSMFNSENSIMYQMDNVGILSYPYGPDVDPDKITAYSVHETMSSCIAIPLKTDNVDETAIVLEALYEPLNGYETREQIAEYLNRNLFFDPRDTELFLDMIPNAHYTFFRDGARRIQEKTIGYRETPIGVTEALEQWADHFDTICTNYLEPALNGIRAVWGDDVTLN